MRTWDLLSASFVRGLKQPNPAAIHFEDTDPQNPVQALIFIAAVAIAVAPQLLQVR